jgi:hypothetical protein
MTSTSKYSSNGRGPQSATGGRTTLQPARFRLQFQAIVSSVARPTISTLITLIPIRSTGSCPNWREHLKCPSYVSTTGAGSIHILHQVCMVRPSSRRCYHRAIDTTVPGNPRPLPQFNRQRIYGQLFAIQTINENGLRSEAIANLTFPAKCFDQILTFDVLEHVPDYARVSPNSSVASNPEGRCFSVYLSQRTEPTTVRAQANLDGTVSHLLPRVSRNPLSNHGCNFAFIILAGMSWKRPDEWDFQDVSALFLVARVRIHREW